MEECGDLRSSALGNGEVGVPSRHGVGVGLAWAKPDHLKYPVPFKKRKNEQHYSH